MSRTVELTWEGDLGAMGWRRARASFRYQAFVPDEIVALSPVVPFEVADLSVDAEGAIRALNDRASVGGLEAIGPLLLRSEAVASSRIEGCDVSSLDVARALIDTRAARAAPRPWRQTCPRWRRRSPSVTDPCRSRWTTRWTSVPPRCRRSGNVYVGTQP